MHTLERQADQLMYAGAWPDAPTEPGAAPGPDLSWLRGYDDRPVAGAVRPRPYVMFVPGGSAHRPEKRWPVDQYGELARILYARGLDIVIIGGPHGPAPAPASPRHVPPPGRPNGPTPSGHTPGAAASAAHA